MASEQFSLCWDNFHKNMSSGMNSLLENEDLVDVTLAVEGKYLKAHKMVLSVCSPYFRELFKVNPCKHPIVFMKDVSYVAMSDLLQFMYQGEVQVSQENLTTFIKTAEALQIKGLTGDGNGSAECDNDQDEPKPTDVELPKPTPRPMKKVHQVPTPPAKRPRLSAPEPSAPPAVTKTEPAAVSSASNNDQLIQFKMEPYDQGQSTVTIPDDNADETFTDDPLDETNADDGNEDYSMMEGGDEEPQAGTSADGTAGEGQGFLGHATIKIEEDKTELVDESFHNLMQNIPTSVEQHMAAQKSSQHKSTQPSNKDILKILLKIQKRMHDRQEKIINELENIRSMLDFMYDTSVNNEQLILSQTLSSHTTPRETTETDYFPVASIEILEKVEQELADENYRSRLIDKMSIICGPLGTMTGINCCYTLVDKFFTRDLLTKFSWSGGSRNSDKKASFRKYANIIKTFHQIVTKTDITFSEISTESFFKSIIKNSKRRALVLPHKARASRGKNRPKNLTYRSREIQSPGLSFIKMEHGESNENRPDFSTHTVTYGGGPAEEEISSEENIEEVL